MGTLANNENRDETTYHIRSTGSALFATVNSENFVRILFSRTALKNIFATLKSAARA